MSAIHRNLRLTGAFAVLAILALGAACRGFFQNPILSSLTISPANPTIETGNTDNTVQMVVSGTNNDGSPTSNPSVSWSISDTSVASISSTGLVKSVATGTATITATSKQNSAVSATQTVTVVVGCIQSITVAPSSGAVTSTQTASFTATANTCNGSPDITSVATWTSSNTNLATVAGGVVSETAGNTQTGNVQITASITTPSGTITSNAVTVSVAP